MKPKPSHPNNFYAMRFSLAADRGCAWALYMLSLPYLEVMGLSMLSKKLISFWSRTVAACELITLAGIWPLSTDGVM